MAETVKKGARITGVVADQPDAVQDDGAQIASGAFDPALTLDRETVLAEIEDADIIDAEIMDAEIIDDAAEVTGPDVIDADTDRS